MSSRKIELAEGEFYHIISKSIASFEIFNSDKDYRRMMNEIVFYNTKKAPCKFSLFKQLKEESNLDLSVWLDYSKKLVAIVAYCLMPTHIHFILKQLQKNGISNFIRLILNSYSKYFNIKHNRRGPLWEGRFKNVLMENDDQFIHVTRYIHLNPVTARLVDDPKNWNYSSYREYIGLVNKSGGLCNFSEYLDINADCYQKFVKDQISYQRELARIKHLTLE